MFISENNSLNYKKIAIGVGAVLALCVAGVLWFDAPLFVFLRGFDWWPWALADVIFSAGNWLVVSAVGAVIWFVVRYLKLKNKTVALPSPRRTTGPSSNKVLAQRTETL